MRFYCIYTGESCLLCRVRWGRVFPLNEYTPSPPSPQPEVGVRLKERDHNTVAKVVEREPRMREVGSSGSH